MGLDQYAYCRAKAESEEWNDGREIAYWRKHPKLQGWMEHLYRSRGGKGDFNGDELELTWADLEQLEQDIKTGVLPETRGFFFGENSDDYYKETDLKFIRDAKAEIFSGLKVFYNSSW